MPEEELTASLVWEYSDKLAAYLHETYKGDKSPIVVYGHKHPFMLVYFLACVKSGHAYCPVDVNTPIDRVEDIIATVKSPVVLVSEEITLEVPTLTVPEAKEVIVSTTKRISKRLLCSRRRYFLYYLYFWKYRKTKRSFDYLQ